MPSWKKIITSGSDASLSSLTTSGNIAGSSIISSTGSFGRVEATTFSADNLLQGAFDEDSNGDLMPLAGTTLLSVFYELDGNDDLMPRT